MTFLVLSPFIYPLFWAVLIGQALFPSKALVMELLEDFLQVGEPSSSSNFFGQLGNIPLVFRFILVIPILLNSMSDLLVDYIWRSKKNIVYIGLSTTLIYWFQAQFLYFSQFLFFDKIPLLLEAMKDLLVTEQLVGILTTWFISWVSYLNWIYETFELQISTSTKM